MFTPVEPGPTFSSRVGAVAKARETGIVLALLLVVAATTIKSPTFLFSSDGWRDLLLTPSILLVVAMGQAIVIITRNVDLSVGSVLGLTAYLTGKVFLGVPGVPIIVVFVLGIAFGAVLGLVNGALVAFAKVPALVITLGTLYAYRGINVAWAGSDLINASDMPADVPRAGHQDDPDHPGVDADCRGRPGGRRLVLKKSAAAASSTRSGRIRPPRSCTDCPSPDGCSSRSWSAARPPAWAG